MKFLAQFIVDLSYKPEKLAQYIILGGFANKDSTFQKFEEKKIEKLI